MVVESADTLHLTDIEVDGLTLLGEARGLHYPIGMVEVSWVIRNRVAAKKWWGSTERAVCLYPWQFSCWNANDPNRAKLLKWPQSDPIYLKALDIAAGTMIGAAGGMIGTGDDPTNGATHYFNHLIIPQASWPKWYTGQTPCMIDGPIWYFNLAESG